MAVDVGEAEVPARMAEGELLVVEAQQGKQGGVEVVDVDVMLDGAVSQFVGPAVFETGARPSAASRRVSASRSRLRSRIVSWRVSIRWVGMKSETHGYPWISTKARNSSVDKRFMRGSSDHSPWRANSLRRDQGAGPPGGWRG